MAAKEVLEKHFNCSICQDQYNNPRRLTCGHVYCHGCVDDLIRRTAGYYWILRGTKQVIGFKCPECRKIVRIPRPEEPPERWVHQINKDFKLDDILADLKDIVLQNDVKEREKKEKESLPKEIEIRTATKTYAVQGSISKDSTLAPAAIAEVIEHETASEQGKEVLAEDENEEKKEKQILTLIPDSCQILETVDQANLQRDPLVSPPRTTENIHKQASVKPKGSSLIIEVTDKVEAHGFSEPMMLVQNGASPTTAAGFGLKKRFEDETSHSLDFSVPSEVAVQEVNAEDEKKKKKQLLTHRPDFCQILETVDQVNLKHDPLISPPITADNIHKQASVNTKGNSLKIVPDKVEAHGFCESLFLVQNGASLTIATGLELREKKIENEKSRVLDFSFRPEEAFQGNRTENELGWDEKYPWK